MPDVAFVVSPRQHYSLRELATTIQYELERQAVSGSVHLGGFPEVRPDRVYVLVDPYSYAGLEGDQALPDDSVLSRTVFLCVERPPEAAEEDRIRLLHRAGAVFVINQRALVAMRRLGIPARLIRPGYSESLDHFDPDAARPVDIVFLGAHSLRRTKYLSLANRVLSRYESRLHISDDGGVDGDTSSFLAESRWRLLAQTKVLINIHCGTETGLEWRRVLDAVHAGAVVVTEHSSGIAPFVPGEHLLVASADSLPYVAEALLHDPERLATLRADAYERLATWIPYALPVAVLRAAVVELVGEPVDAGASRGRPRPGPKAAGHDERLGALTGDRTIGRVNGEGPGSGSRGQTEVGEQTPAWARAEAPKVSVIATMRADRDAIVATLDSLAAGGVDRYEVVIVASGLGSEMLAPVGGWMDDHPELPARLLIVSADNGLGAARNAGIEHSRAPMCFFIDPGQTVYPRCLSALTATLDAHHDVGFVYPIHEITGDADAFVRAGGDYLMNFLGWDPARLCGGDHVHAPALVRTELLREVGGFTTDRHLDGFEDRDLWCRIADTGRDGRLVPQALVRRCESASSAVLSSISTAPR